jgi:hypothetical protein
MRQEDETQETRENVNVDQRLIYSHLDIIRNVRYTRPCCSKVSSHALVSRRGLGREGSRVYACLEPRLKEPQFENVALY